MNVNIEEIPYLNLSFLSLQLIKFLEMDSCIELLSYCENSNNFKWKGTAEELKTFVRSMTSGNDGELTVEDGELIEDTKHKAVSYKLTDLSFRLYYTTVRDKFHELLGTFEPGLGLDEATKADCSVFQPDSPSTCPDWIGLRDEMDLIKKDISSIKAQIGPGSTTQRKEIEAENYELRKKLCILENENKSLSQEICNYKISLQQTIVEK